MMTINNLKDQNRSPAQSTHDLLILVNRVNLLKNEKEKALKRNVKTLQKTNLILSVKYENPKHIKQQQQDNIIINKAQSNKSEHSSVNKFQIDTIMNKFQNINRNKSGEKLIIHQRKSQPDIDLKISQSQIMKSDKTAKNLKVKVFWQDRMTYFANQKQIERDVQTQRCILQEQSIIKLEQLEQNMIQQINESQRMSLALNKQLVDARSLSKDKFEQEYPDMNGFKSTIIKQIPYVQISSRYLNPSNYNKFPAELTLPQISHKTYSQNHDQDGQKHLIQNYKLSLIKIYSQSIKISHQRFSQQSYTERTKKEQVQSGIGINKLLQEIKILSSDQNDIEPLIKQSSAIILSKQQEQITEEEFSSIKDKEKTHSNENISHSQEDHQ